MNSTRHCIFNILTRHTGQEIKFQTGISIDDLIRILEKRYSIQIKRRQVFSHIRALLQEGYMIKESRYDHRASGRIQQRPSFFTRTPAGRYYLQSMGITPK